MTLEGLAYYIAKVIQPEPEQQLRLEKLFDTTHVLIGGEPGIKLTVEKDGSISRTEFKE